MIDLNKLKEELKEWQGFYEHPADEKNHAFFTTLISAVDQLEAAQQRIAELENKTSTSMGIGDGSGNLFVYGDYDSIKAAQSKILRMEAAEAELARRDAAAGEPVAYTSQANLDSISLKQPKQLEFMTGDKSVYRNPISLFTAAQPSALPPEMTRDVSNYDVVDHGFISGYNQAIADAKALGCKAIKLPEPYDDGQGNEWLPCAATRQALKAQGFTVEGE